MLESRSPTTAALKEDEPKEYLALPTLRRFHECPAQIRAIVGPVGSGKTTAAAWETMYYIPYFLLEHYGIRKTKGVIVRGTYAELIDTTQRTVFDWFSWGRYFKQPKNYYLAYPDNGPEIEVLFRSCDRPEDVKKFKSLEITWYWIDESIEVSRDVKLMLRNRIGRFPTKSPVRFGIETTNPPDVEDPTYSEFTWDTPPPGPVPEGQPKENYIGFWQPPGENDKNLRNNYYADLANDYKDNPDWLEMYIQGKPGVIVKGKLIYHNFKRDYHVAKGPLLWAEGDLIRGWDNSGNVPACVVAQMPTAGRLQILREFWSDKANIGSFAKYVTIECNRLWPGAGYTDYADPAGANKFSTRDGGFTSNAALMHDAAGISVISSEQNLAARINSVDDQLNVIDGMLIDPACTRLINGFLGGYCYPEIGNTGEYSDHPLKNRFSHVHDALQYICAKVLKSSPSKGRGFRPRRK